MEKCLSVRKIDLCSRYFIPLANRIDLELAKTLVGNEMKEFIGLDFLNPSFYLK